ncbi:GNAT family N-acetyltransferase [Micromonospora sp. C28SCA-DRY-2]|uniref:GNAT family N-acetyltransferase n=1 Tax=Micromonospora sp. C28SCA-DRY-2 TaxID=3059522 RepID=UPI0026743F6F|nr:GNAT family N-acetyltransferase [Micromonospora sp. C28SCA-DRY-2]MDO3703403.1 GNAT family N-acetyltransferase [Micromonospora sp. C28SCA-DRY-2]
MPDGQINRRQATTDDTAALLSLMDSVLEWLVARGRPEQWGTIPFSRLPGFPERLADWVSQGVVTMAERDGRCVGLLAMAPTVPQRIPPGLVPEGSMFVYTVLSSRGPDGRGVGSTLLAEAERRARAGRAPALALDHWAGSPELARVYEQHGYVAVAEYDDAQGSTRNIVRVRRLSATGSGGPAS